MAFDWDDHDDFWSVQAMDSTGRSADGGTHPFISSVRFGALLLYMCGGDWLISFSTWWVGRGGHGKKQNARGTQGVAMDGTFGSMSVLWIIPRSARCWQLKYFWNFHRRFPIWRVYFSNGLKPPTSLRLSIIFPFLSWYVCCCVQHLPTSPVTWFLEDDKQTWWNFPSNSPIWQFLYHPWDGDLYLPTWKP